MHRRVSFIIALTLFAGLLTASAYITNAQQQPLVPGWGLGDQNHIHIGPPGQSVHIPNNRYKHTFLAGNAVFNILETEQSIHYRNAAGSLVCTPSNITVVNLASTGSITQADILAGAAQCNPNIRTLGHLIQAMREGKISMNIGGTSYSPITWSPQTETPSSNTGNNGSTGGNNGNAGNTTQPTGTPTITPSSATVRPSAHLDFVGRNFGREESVIIKLNGAQIGSAYADGGGNFSTGAMRSPQAPGTYHYTFTGTKSAIIATSTITVQ